MTVKYKESFDYYTEILEKDYDQGILDETGIKSMAEMIFQLGYQAGKDNGPWHPSGGDSE